MRRLRRILLNAASTVSLLLGVAVVALWVRSFWRGDELGIERHAPHAWRLSIISAPRGCLTLAYRSVWRPPRPDAVEIWYFERSTWAPVARWDAFFNRRIIQWELGQFVYAVPPSPPSERFRIITFPLWLPTAAFLAAPLALTIRRLRSKRTAKPGHCPHCGYDLRATPDRCPECGHPSPTQIAL
jgi:hypothetical protein